MDDDDDKPRFMGLMGYEVTCDCGYDFFVEGDCRGDEVTCPDCETKGIVHGLGG